MLHLKKIARLGLLFATSYGMLYFSYRYYVPARDGGDDAMQSHGTLKIRCLAD
jgi:hypothetical protein